MARKGILNAIRDWFKPKNKKISEANRITNYGGGVSTKTVQSEVKRSIVKAEAKREGERQEQRYSAFKSTPPKTSATSSKSEAPKSTTTKKDVFNKANAFKATPPALRKSTALGTVSEKDAQSRIAKRNAYQANRKEQSRAADKLKPIIDKKYDASTKEGRQRIKMGEYQSDPNVAKYETLKHPMLISATRGALSGTTFGLSELAAAKLPKSKEMEEAERLYQANKSKGAEFAGEMIGSLAGFGLTSGASKEALTRLAPNRVAKLGEGATEALAKNGLVRKAAEKEAIRKIGATATKEEIERFARERAAKLVAALGEDAAINLTTGAVSDAAHALIESDDPIEAAKNFGKSALLNVALGGVTSAAPALRGKSNAVDDIAETLGRNIDDTRGIVEFPPRETGIDVINPDLERRKPTLKEKPKPEVRAEEPRAEIKAEPPKTEFDAEAYRESLNDVIPFESEAPTAPKRGLPNSHVTKDENLRRLTENDDLPFATVDDAMPSTSPELTTNNELREGLERRVEKIGKQGADNAGDSVKVNDVATDAPISESLPSGVKQVRSAYDYNNGEKIEDGILTKWNEAWNASKEYSASHAKGEKTRQSKVAVSQLNAMDSEAERELRQRLVDSGDLDYEAISTPEMYDKIAKQMRDDADRWVKDMIDINEGGALDFRSTPEWQARVQYILGTVDPSADAASEIAYTEAFKLAQNISSKGGQVLNLRKNFVHLTPMGKRDAILDDFVNILSKSKGFAKEHPAMNNLGTFDRRNYIRNFLMEDDAIRDGVEKLVQANKADDVSEAFADLMLNVNKKNPKAGFDVLQEWRYLSMLGNPKTHIRNVFGSAFFAPMRQASNAIRAGLEGGIEKYATKKSGVKVQVAKHGGLSPTAVKEAWAKNPTTEAGKAAKEAFERMRNEILGSAKYDTVSYTGRGKTVAGKALDTVSDFNANWLSKEDDFFRSRAFKENYIKSYNRYLKDKTPITDKVKRQIEKEALQEAQIATFNEFNDFAKLLNRLQSKAGDVNAKGWQRWGSRAVNAALPFTKVPANLMKQSVNYSPLGLVKGMAGIKAAASKGDATALNRAIDELASGLTGSAVFGLGMLLGKTTHNMFGLEANVTTNTGKNDPAAKFMKDRGMQNYSITFKDPETGKGQSFTLDWLVPTSATFFSGVEFANQLKQGKLGLSAFGDWSTVVSRLAEPVMETSMLSGLHGMLETMRSGSRSDDDKGAIDVLIRELGQSYLNSIVPTLVGQGARTLYGTDKQITGDTDWEYWRNQTKSKAGLANTKILGEPLGADTDAYGNVKGEKKSAEDYVKSGLKNFLSPANIQKVDISEVDKQKLAEYEKAVKDGADPTEMAYLFPKKQYKKEFKVGDEKVKMSNRDLSTYNQAKTKGGEEGMRYALESIMFNRRTTDENGKNVPRDDAYTKEQKEALMKEFKGKSMREVEKWIYEQPEFKSATDAEKRKLIKGLWSLDSVFDSKAVASRRVGEQAVIKAQGGDVDKYNFENEVTEKKRAELAPAVESGLLTYAQVVDFNRNAAKMGYYENEDGGTSRATYNREGILAYLESADLSEEAKEALYNAYYTGKTPYGQEPYRRGYYRRRGYRRWHRRGRGGKKKAAPMDVAAFKATKMPSTKTKATKMPSSTSKVNSSPSRSSRSTTAPKSTSSVNAPKYKSLATALKTSGNTRGETFSPTSSVKYDTASAVKKAQKKKKTTVKKAPPKVKFKKYEV